MTNEVISVAAAAQAPSKMDLMREYVTHHAMYHYRSLDAWNLPFLHVKWLDYFRLDSVMVVFSAVVLVLVFTLGYKRNQKVPRGFSLVLESLVKFVRDHIAIPFLGEQDGRKLTPLFCMFFFYILTMNLLGLLPIFSSATSNINVTGALALTTLGFMVLGAIVRNGPVAFLKSFLLPDVPLGVQFFVVPLEVISLFTNTFALMVRLFANILAGHMIIFSLVGVVFVFGWWALPAAALAVCIYFFELCVGVFQAYIFTLLSAVYIGKTYHPNH